MVSVYISAVIMKPNQVYLLNNQYVIVKKLEELLCYKLIVRAGLSQYATYAAA